MKLLTKFNLILIFVFLISMLVASIVFKKVLKDYTEHEIINHARMMMEGAMAIRKYTIDEIRPLISMQSANRFLPQTVPSYAATQNFNMLKKSNPDYAYKEATLNPTNPRDKATDWEADIIQQFRNKSELKEIVGKRETPTGMSFYLAHPIRIINKDCLTCHSTLDKAPKSMLKLYGTANGFGWRHQEVVGSQIVSVPTSVAFEMADKKFNLFLISLIIIFVVLFTLINLLLWFMVIKKVNIMSAIADQLSQGDNNAPELNTSSNDEIATLAKSFNRMRVSLEKAMKMLE